MRFGHLEIFTADPARAARFYREVLGFEVVADQGGGLLWLACGQVEFLLRPGSPPEAPERYEDAAAGIVLYTEDLDAAADRLRERGLAFEGTIDSDRCLTFRDPDGNWFQLVDPEGF